MSSSSLIAEPLWIRARASFARAIEAVGAPAVIAAMASLSQHLRRAISERLLRLEHIARKLLLAEAAEIHRAEQERAKRTIKIETIPSRGMAQIFSADLQARADAPASKRGSVDPRSIDKAHPETWSAPFSFALPRDPHRLPDSRAPRIRALWGPTQLTPPTPERKPRVIRAEETPFRLARRLEALRRVFADPLPYAERLASMLARVRRGFREVVFRYWSATSRTNAYDKADERLCIDAYGPASFAHLAFKDSS